MTVRLPLSVVMLALRLTLRPACSVSAPPLPPLLLTLSAAPSVMSLLACSTTLVPVSRMAWMLAGVMVLSAVGLLAKVALATASAVPPAPGLTSHTAPLSTKPPRSAFGARTT